MTARSSNDSNIASCDQQAATSWEEIRSVRAARQAAQGRPVAGDRSLVRYPRTTTAMDISSSSNNSSSSDLLRDFQSPMQAGVVTLGDLASNAYFGCNRVAMADPALLPPFQSADATEQRDPTAANGGRNMTYRDLHDTIQRVLDIVSDDDF